MMRALTMTSQQGRWQMFSPFSKNHQINPSTIAKPAACSYSYRPIHNKEWRDATNKLAQMSGTSWPAAEIFGELVCSCCPCHIVQNGGVAGADTIVDQFPTLHCTVQYIGKFKCHNFLASFLLSQHCDMKVNDFCLIITTYDKANWQDSSHKCFLVIYDWDNLKSIPLMGQSQSNPCSTLTVNFLKCKRCKNLFLFTAGFFLKLTALP